MSSPDGEIGTKYLTHNNFTVTSVTDWRKKVLAPDKQKMSKPPQGEYSSKENEEECSPHGAAFAVVELKSSAFFLKPVSKQGSAVFLTEEWL